MDQKLLHSLLRRGMLPLLLDDYVHHDGRVTMESAVGVEVAEAADPLVKVLTLVEIGVMP